MAQVPTTPLKYPRIGVMCGSSEGCPQHYLDLAYSIGVSLGEKKHTVIYGGGAKGLMRQVADGTMASGGQVEGYIPEFMTKVEWQHKDITKLHITNSMADRKEKMMKNSDATLFLPGGCGTMEEFFEWLSSKRLGLYLGPLVIFNYRGYYDPLIGLLHHMENEGFHRAEHGQMYSVAHDIPSLYTALEEAPDWKEDAIHFAHVGKDNQ